MSQTASIFLMHSSKDAHAHAHAMWHVMHCVVPDVMFGTKNTMKSCTQMQTLTRSCHSLMMFFQGKILLGCGGRQRSKPETWNDSGNHYKRQGTWQWNCCSKAVALSTACGLTLFHSAAVAGDKQRNGEKKLPAKRLGGGTVLESKHVLALQVSVRFLKMTHVAQVRQMQHFPSLSNMAHFVPPSPPRWAWLYGHSEAALFLQTRLFLSLSLSLMSTKLKREEDRVARLSPPLLSLCAEENMLNRMIM